MANISKIKLPNGSLYDIKDQNAISLVYANVLPEPSLATLNKIYLIPNSTEGRSIKDEYITITVNADNSEGFVYA